VSQGVESQSVDWPAAGAAPFPARAPGAPPLPAAVLPFIWYFVARRGGWYAAMLLLETAHASCGILVPYALADIIKGVTNAVAAHGPLIESLQQPLWLFCGLSLGEVLFGRAAGSCQITIGPLQRHRVTRELYAYLQEHSHRYLSDNFAGALAHRISETSTGVTQTVWTILFDFWPMLIVFSVSTALLSRAHAQLALFVGLWSFGFTLACYLLARRCQPHALRAASARSETTGKVVDAVTNLASTKLFARGDFEREHLDDCLRRELKLVRVSGWYSERVRWFQFLAAALLKVGVLYYALSLWDRGEIGVADFVMAVSLSLLIINEARGLSRRFLEFFEFVGNVENGVRTLVRPHELVDLARAPEARVQRGRIEFRHVSFGYTPDRSVFEDMNLRIEPGQRVGLVGLSGSGKSTLVHLLLRLYDVRSGQILLDGEDIANVTQDSLHAQIGFIPQDPTLFHRSLLENIRYGRVTASDAEVMEAARAAHAHEFIAALPEGYGALVGERGVKLSGGQRQRIAIARVILKNAPVLILDEATSSLDSITERAIQETLENVMRDKTVLVVAHRLSTIAHLDRILVLHHGRVVEDGTHAELLARGGAYHQLWTKQVDGFLPESSTHAPVPACEPGDALVRPSRIPPDPVEAPRDEPEPSLA